MTTLLLPLYMVTVLHSLSLDTIAIKEESHVALNIKLTNQHALAECEHGQNTLSVRKLKEYKYSFKILTFS